MAKAVVRGRPIAPLVLSQQERTYLERQVRRHRVARLYKAKRTKLAEAAQAKRAARVAERRAEAARLADAGLKHCTKCSKTKPFDLFSKDRSAEDGLQLWCKECRYDQKRQYRAEHPEKRQAEDRKRRSADPVKSMLSGAHRRARRQGIPCTIAKDDIGSIPDTCPALRVPLVVGVGRGTSPRRLLTSVSRLCATFGATSRSSATARTLSKVHGQRPSFTTSLTRAKTQ